MVGEVSDGGRAALVAVAIAAAGAMGYIGTRQPVQEMVITGPGLVGIADREKFRAPAYRDSAGVLTNGYGNTHNVDPNKRVTPERALIDLLHNTNAAAEGIKRCITIERAYPYEFDAWVALAVNVGVGNFCRSSPRPDENPYLIDLINAGRYEEACDRFLAFNKIRNPRTGQLEPSKGLADARAKERLRCLGREVL